MIVAHAGCGCADGYPCDRQRLLDRGFMQTTIYSNAPTRGVGERAYKQMQESAALLVLDLSEPVVTEESERDRSGGRRVTTRAGVFDPEPTAAVVAQPYCAYRNKATCTKVVVETIERVRMRYGKQEVLRFGLCEYHAKTVKRD